MNSIEEWIFVCRLNEGIAPTRLLFDMLKILEFTPVNAMDSDGRADRRVVVKYVKRLVDAGCCDHKQYPVSWVTK